MVTIWNHLYPMKYPIATHTHTHTYIYRLKTWGSPEGDPRWEPILVIYVGWGGVGWDVDVRCQDVHAVDATLPMGWGGVGWGGMLTFAARCTRCGCYVADGLGWGGMLTFAARCTRCGCYVADGLGWGGVGWDVNVRCKMYTLWMLRCRWAGVGWSGAGCWRSLQDVHAVLPSMCTQTPGLTMS